MIKKRADDFPLSERSRSFQQEITRAQGLRRGSVGQQIIQCPANRETPVLKLAATDLIFLFDTTYPHPGGEADFGISINGGAYMAFLDPPAPPWEISDLFMYSIQFINRTGTDKTIRFMTGQNPQTVEGA